MKSINPSIYSILGRLPAEYSSLHVSIPDKILTYVPERTPEAKVISMVRHIMNQAGITE